MTEAAPPSGRTATVIEYARALANPVSIRGAIGVVVGVLVLMLPELTVTLVQIVLGAALAVSGSMDIWYALVGRRRFGKRRNRVFSFVRGTFTLLFVALLVWLPTTDLRADAGLNAFVGLAGIYLGIRGAIVLIATFVKRKQLENLGIKYAGGAASVAIGVLAYVSPTTTTDGIIVAAAVAGVVGGVILLAYGMRQMKFHDGRIDPQTASIAEIMWDWIRVVDVGETDREAFAEGLYFEHPGRYGKLAAWWVMLVLSVAIATYAVLSDSTAVVIGAMLVAPLMVPILGLAGALVNGWRARALQSTIMVALGVIVAVSLSYGLASWAPVAISFDTNTQITSRVNPTLLDMLIAIAAGAAGAFATVNKRVASSIAGVAIAVALVPPLSVVGISLSAGRWDEASGALLLFVTNFVAIVLSAATVFVLGGFAESGVLRRRPTSLVVTIAPFAALAAVVLVPLIFASEGLLATSTQERETQKVIDTWLGTDTELLVDTIIVEPERVTVSLIGSDAAPPVGPLQEALIDELGHPVSVRVAVTPVIVTELEAPAPA